MDSRQGHALTAGGVDLYKSGDKWGEVGISPKVNITSFIIKICGFFMSPLLLGQFQHSLDEKNRVSIPKRFRAALDPRKPDDAFHLTRGFGRSIWMFTEAQLLEVSEMFTKLRGGGMGSEKVRDFERAFYQHCQTGVPDKQGRIVVVEALIDHARIQKDVVFIGMPHRIEVWAAEELARAAEDFDAEWYDEVGKEIFG